MDKALERYALDWQQITDGWIKRLDAEMEAAFSADDGPRYLFAGRLKGDIETARHVMLRTLTMGPGQQRDVQRDVRPGSSE